MSRALVAGRVLSGLAALFLAFDTLGKLLLLPPVVEGTAGLGYPVGSIRGIGIAQLVCLVLYLVPRTRVLGAVVLTGYLGGAVATHVRIGSPLLTHVLFPTYIAALAGGGLWLREGRLRSLVPLTRTQAG